MKYPLTHVRSKIYENGISRTPLCRSENVRPAHGKTLTSVTILLPEMFFDLR
jgi:hypothetical protein